MPAHNTPIKPGRREALPIAIAKARNWIDDLAHGREFRSDLLAGFHTLRGYVRDAELFQDHAGAGLL